MTAFKGLCGASGAHTVDRRALEVIVSRKPDYAVILECVGDGTTMGELVLCAMERGLSRSYSTIVQKVVTLSRYGVLKLTKLGKYTVVTKAVELKKAR